MLSRVLKRSASCQLPLLYSAAVTRQLRLVLERVEFSVSRSMACMQRRAVYCRAVNDIPQGCQNSEGCKQFVRLFSYTIWSSAMTFGTMTDIGAYQILSHFGEFLSTFPGA